jgi:NUDIX domain
MQTLRTPFRTCDEVTHEQLNRLRLRSLRPGAKVVLYDKRGRLLWGRLPDGYPSRFNFSGGGIDDGELLAVALAREFTEEMDGPPLSVEALQQSPIVAEGQLPFAREGYRGKYEYLIACEVSSIRAYTPRHDSKLVIYPPMYWENVLVTMRCSTYVKRDMRILYTKAVKNVGKLLAA